MTDTWKETFQYELEQAQAAREAGNEGRARVNARRAAGVIAGQWLAQHGYAALGPSAYDRLRDLAARPGLPVGVRPVVEHFLTRVTPEYTLPMEADLIAEARWLAQVLLDFSV